MSADASSKEHTVTIVDNKTGKSVTVPVIDGAIAAPSLWSGLKLRSYDPAYMNTAVAKSKICDIDGDKGILRYRGYKIEDLAEKSSHLEVAFLLLFGELPTPKQYKRWHDEVMDYSFVNTGLVKLVQAFNYDSHCQGIFVAAMAALGCFTPEANPAFHGPDIFKTDLNLRYRSIARIIGQATTVGALIMRNRFQQAYNEPVINLEYTENFLYMVKHRSGVPDKIDPRLSRAMDVLFILHADHEMNCSTAAMRHIGSAKGDPYSCVAGASAALYGPLHGGANESVLRMLEEIQDVSNVDAFVEGVKNKSRRLMGFGHRIYKAYDPRATIVRKIAYQVFEVLGKEPLIDVALALEKRALTDDYFIKRSLYPNVDFYTGLIYKAMGFPTDFFTVLFSIARVAGWLSHWSEALDTNTQIWRPRQIYVGHDVREYVPMELREKSKARL